MRLKSSILVEIAAGELLDKIAILELKAEHITDPAKLANVKTELAALEAVRDRTIEPGEQLDALVRELKAVLARGWKIEDDVRACERDGRFDATFIEIARSIYRNNDERMRIKRRINDLLGSRIVEEKSHKDG